MTVILESFKLSLTLSKKKRHNYKPEHQYKTNYIHVVHGTFKYWDIAGICIVYLHLNL